MGLSLAALIVPLILSTCNGCGVTVHNEVAYRASQLLAIPPVSSSWPSPEASVSPPSWSPSDLGQNVLSPPTNARQQQDGGGSTVSAARPLDRFRDMILQRKEFLLSGSFFPDWGYDCIGKLWNNAAEEDLVVFLFGTVSHEAADVLWHGLEGISGGFVSALAMTSFEGDYSKAHTLADLGGEFVLSHMADMGHLATTWKVPIRDLTMIYKRLDHFVPGTVLSHCMRNGYAASQANSRLGGKLFPVYASKSPFLVEQMEDYPIGGLRDMTAWTVECWQGLARHLDQRFGPEESHHDHHRQDDQPFKLCDVFREPEEKSPASRRGQQSPRPLHRPHTPTSATAAISQLLESGYTIRTDEDESTGTVAFSVERSLDHHHPLNTNRDVETEETVNTIAADPTCASLSEDTDFITQILYLPLPYSSFGHAVVTGDFDGDGVPEIAISAPHATFDSHVPSQGAVYIIPASKVSEHQSQQRKHQRHHQRPHEKEPSPLPPLDARAIASVILVGNASEPQARFGWSLATVDLNGDGIDDLAIGAPGEGSHNGLQYSGAIYVFFGRKDIGLREATLDNADLVIRHKIESESAPQQHQQQQYDEDHYHQKQKISSWLYGWRADGTRAERGPPPPLPPPPECQQHHQQHQQTRAPNSLVGLGTRLQGVDLTGDGFKDLVVQSPLANVQMTLPKPSPPWGDFPDPEPVLLSQAGKVSVFLASTRHKGIVVADTARDWELAGKVAYGWFGASLAFFQERSERASPPPPPPQHHENKERNQEQGRRQANQEARSIMVVGSPMLGLMPFQEEKVMIGQIQGFVLPSRGTTTTTAIGESAPLEPTPIFTLQGNLKFQQFGSRLEALYVPLDLPGGDDDGNDSGDGSTPPSPATVVLHPILVVGSQSEEIKVPLPRVGKLWQAGAVRVLNLTQIPDGTETTIGELEDRGRGGDGGRRRCPHCPRLPRFPRVPRLPGIPRTPHRALSPLSHDQDQDQGIKGRSGGGGDEDKEELGVVLATLQGSQSLAHLSAAMAVSTASKWTTSSYSSSSSKSKSSGSLAPPMTAPAKDGIWLTEPLAAAEAGRILRWEPELGRGGGAGDGGGGNAGKGNAGGDGDKNEPPMPPDGVSQCYLGSDTRGRFGAVIVVEDLNMDGMDDLIVTSAHSSTFAT
ncbi:Glycosylphosphatidylinositol specific phospholipase D1 [Actinomortierella ambigua]|nr:Glycosylphosphatidylinositol specific phospholipase D1 [Actinomortierella ambigua]